MAAALVKSEKFAKAVADVLQKVSEGTIDPVSKKDIRRRMEEKFDLKEKELDTFKSEISQVVDLELEKQDDDSGSEDDDGGAGEAAAPAPKKRKKAPAPAAEPKKKPKLVVITKSGAEAPKNAAKDQGDAMTGADFLANANDLEVKLFGNTVKGEPREFTSGKYGWYAGGKIEVEVNGKTIWGQLGINLVMIGSQTW
eukprot:m.420196 g.420196  ORF g.420196 m.420196 type:complete len:197 (+) comp21314_c0_seq2:217-807(+)